MSGISFDKGGGSFKKTYRVRVAPSCEPPEWGGGHPYPPHTNIPSSRNHVLYYSVFVLVLVVLAFN